MSDIEDAAKTLHDALLIQCIRRDAFSIGIGSDRLHVYVRGPKNRWPITVPSASDEGVPIEWHWNVGPITAGAVGGPAHDA